MRQHIADISNEDWDSVDHSFYLEPSERTSNLTSIVLTLIFSIIFIASSSLNTLFLVIFFRKQSLRNVSNRFIVSLTISNLVSAWVLLPLVVTDMFLKEWRPSDTKIDFLGLPETADVLCASFNVITDFTTSSSVFGTVLIAFDRFFAITQPLHYNRLVTRAKSWLLMFFCWLLAFGVGTFSGLITNNENRWNVCQLEEELEEDSYSTDPKTVESQTEKGPTITEVISKDERYFRTHIAFATFSFICCFVAPLLMIMWYYSKIYREAQQTSERARRNSLCNSTLEVASDYSKTPPSRSSSIKSTSSTIVTTIRRRISNASLFLYKEEARTAKISVSVIILFICYWFPFYCTLIVDAMLGEDKLPPYIFKVVLVFTLLNSVISPYLYMYRSKRIQKEVLRLFGVSSRLKRNEIERRRPLYHQVPPRNLEKIPASPLCFDGSFNMEASAQMEAAAARNQDDLDQSNFFLKFFVKKLSRHLLWNHSSTLSNSSCISVSSLNNIHSTSIFKTSLNNINSTSITKSSLKPIDSNSISKNLPYHSCLSTSIDRSPSSNALTNLLYPDKGALLPDRNI